MNFNELLSLAFGYARAVVRRKWLALGVAWGVALLAWLAILTIPDRYEAAAVVYVDANTSLRPVLEGIAIEEDIQSQLYKVRESLLSRPHLETVARRLNLAKSGEQHEIDGAVLMLQNEIQVEADRPDAAGGPVNDVVYRVKYQSEDRARAMQVVSVLLENFEEGTLAGTQGGSEERSEFLDAQIDTELGKIRKYEETLAEFKKRNVGLIPGEGGDYYTRLQREEDGKQKAETDLAVAYGRRQEYARQLQRTQPYLTGTGGTTSMSGVPDISAQRLEREQRLATLRLTYHDTWPEIQQLIRTIAEMKEQESKEMAELQRGGAGTGLIKSLTANPQYDAIKGQLTQTDVEIAALNSAIGQHQKEIARLKQFSDKGPEVEQEYAELTRDLAATQRRYDQLMSRREQTRVSSDAIRTGAVKFEVIEPPRADESPVSPKRQLMVLAALVFAIGAGIGLAIVPRILMPTFDDTLSLQRETGLPVLGAVSVAQTAAQRAAQTREMRRAMVAAAALMVVAVVMLAGGSSMARLING